MAVTYGPGAFSLVNAVAAAYAERSPVIVISGGPPLQAYRDQPLMHHIMPGRYDASRKIFEQVTVGATVLSDPATAVAEIDDLLRLAIQESRPVYLEIPQDLQRRDCGVVPDWSCPGPTGDRDATAAALGMLVERLQRSKSCVLLVGHEVRAAGLEAPMRALVDQDRRSRRDGIFRAARFPGRSSPLHWPVPRPGQPGPDQGIRRGRRHGDLVRRGRVRLQQGWLDGEAVAGAGDPDLRRPGRRGRGEFRARAPRRSRRRSARAFARGPLGAPGPTQPGLWAPRRVGLSRRVGGTPITNQRFYDRLANFLGESDVILADAGPSINMCYLEIPPGARFIVSGYWASIGGGFGMSLGACIGAGSAAAGHCRGG